MALWLRWVLVAIGVTMFAGGILMIWFRVRLAKWLRDAGDPRFMFMPPPLGTERLTPLLMRNIGLGVTLFGAAIVSLNVTEA